MERNGTYKMLSVNKIISGPLMARLKQSLSMPARANQGREKNMSVFKEAPWRKYVFTKGRALGTQRKMSWLQGDLYCPLKPSSGSLYTSHQRCCCHLCSVIQQLFLSDAPPSTDCGHWPQWTGSTGFLNAFLCI